jgi:hypothetical protein
LPGLKAAQLAEVSGAGYGLANVGEANASPASSYVALPDPGRRLHGAL